jgi:dTDP-4-amino-4,6-dideoxygalactose transaminase
MKKNNILLWNYWSWNNIVPAGVNEKNTRYKTWSCPVSEDISSRIVTIPNHKLVSIKDMEKIISLINKFK